MRVLRGLVFAVVAAGCEAAPATSDGGVGPPPAVDFATPARADMKPGMPAGAAGTLRIVALDDETGWAIPARALITGGGSGKPCVVMDDWGNDPACAATERCTNGAHPDQKPRCVARFDLDGTGKAVKGEYGIGTSPGVIGAPEGVLLVAGDGALKLPPGDYDVFVTRGPEWEAVEQRVTVGPTQGATVTASLRHSVDTRGWLAADMHVHTRRSYDSRLGLEDRVVSEVAVGVEIIVTTDHNVITDLQPQVETLGYGALAHAIVGNEFNFFEGHGGVYPMPYDPQSMDGGATAMHLDWDSVKMLPGSVMFPMLHAYPWHPAVTVNHPRLPPDLGYFLNKGWSPPSTLDTAGQFDGLEILNGYMDAPVDRAALLRDWFFLLSSGYRVTALGNSDTHRLRDVKAGFPRTWLAMPTEDPSQVTGADLSGAIKGGRAIASNGPFAALTVDGTAIGGVVAPKGKAKLAVEATVDAPGWIALDTVRLIVNGQVAQEFTLPPTGRPVFHRTIDVPVPPTDSWIALEATGSRPLPAALVGEHQNGAVTPFVITNPVFVDSDGDGRWRPQIAQPDPGPLAPQSPDPMQWYHREGDPAPEDCEPPLWADPATWGQDMPRVSP